MLCEGGRTVLREVGSFRLVNVGTKKGGQGTGAHIVGILGDDLLNSGPLEKSLSRLLMSGGGKKRMGLLSGKKCANLSNTKRQERIRWGGYYCNWGYFLVTLWGNGKTLVRGGLEQGERATTISGSFLCSVHP